MCTIQGYLNNHGEFLDSFQFLKNLWESKASTGNVYQVNHKLGATGRNETNCYPVAHHHWSGGFRKHDVSLKDPEAPYLYYSIIDGGKGGSYSSYRASPSSLSKYTKRKFLGPAPDADSPNEDPHQSLSLSTQMAREKDGNNFKSNYNKYLCSSLLSSDPSSSNPLASRNGYKKGTSRLGPSNNQMSYDSRKPKKLPEQLINGNNEESSRKHGGQVQNAMRNVNGQSSKKQSGMPLYTTSLKTVRDIERLKEETSSRNYRLESLYQPPNIKAYVQELRDSLLKDEDDYYSYPARKNQNPTTDTSSASIVDVAAGAKYAYLHNKDLPAVMKPRKSKKAIEEPNEKSAWQQSNGNSTNAYPNDFYDSSYKAAGGENKVDAKYFSKTDELNLARIIGSAAANKQPTRLSSKSFILPSTKYGGDGVVARDVMGKSSFYKPIATNNSNNTSSTYLMKPASSFRNCDRNESTSSSSVSKYLNKSNLAPTKSFTSSITANNASNANADPLMSYETCERDYSLHGTSTSLKLPPLNLSKFNGTHQADRCTNEYPFKSQSYKSVNHLNSSPTLGTSSADYRKNSVTALSNATTAAAWLNIKFPMSPKEALKLFAHHLSGPEHKEILKFDDIWYMGKIDRNSAQLPLRPSTTTLGASQDSGYAEDEKDSVHQSYTNATSLKRFAASGMVGNGMTSTTHSNKSGGCGATNLSYKSSLRLNGLSGCGLDTGLSNVGYETTMSSKSNESSLATHTDKEGLYKIVEGDHIAYRYEIIELLGQGSFSQVVKIYDHKDKKYLALKIIRNKKRFHQQALTEIKLLENLQTPYSTALDQTVRMMEYFYFRQHLCIVFELLGPSLYDMLKKTNFRGFRMELVRDITSALLKCLSTLRRHRIIHCDFKPENILVKPNTKFDIKLIDFGSSCYESEQIYTYIQSRFYRSPEVILGLAKYSTAIDMWSLGCVAAELYSGFPLFPGENEQHQVACFVEILGLPPIKDYSSGCDRWTEFFDSKCNLRYNKRSSRSTKNLSSVLKSDDYLFIDFLYKCFRWNPKERLTPREGINHPWITGEIVNIHDFLASSTNPSERSLTTTTASTYSATTGYKSKIIGSSLASSYDAGSGTTSRKYVAKPTYTSKYLQDLKYNSKYDSKYEPTSLTKKASVCRELQEGDKPIRSTAKSYYAYADGQASNKLALTNNINGNDGNNGKAGDESNNVKMSNGYEPKISTYKYLHLRQESDIAPRTSNNKDAKENNRESSLKPLNKSLCDLTLKDNTYEAMKNKVFVKPRMQPTHVGIYTDLSANSNPPKTQNSVSLRSKTEDKEISSNQRDQSRNNKSISPILLMARSSNTSNSSASSSSTTSNSSSTSSSKSSQNDETSRIDKKLNLTKEANNLPCRLLQNLSLNDSMSQSSNFEKSRLMQNAPKEQNVAT